MRKVILFCAATLFSLLSLKKVSGLYISNAIH